MSGNRDRGILSAQHTQPTQTHTWGGAVSLGRQAGCEPDRRLALARCQSVAAHTGSRGRQGRAPGYVAGKRGVDRPTPGGNNLSVSTATLSTPRTQQHSQGTRPRRERTPGDPETAGGKQHTHTTPGPARRSAPAHLWTRCWTRVWPPSLSLAASSPPLSTMSVPFAAETDDFPAKEKNGVTSHVRDLRFGETTFVTSPAIARRGS